jgi:hypothetical protein
METTPQKADIQIGYGKGFIIPKMGRRIAA